MADILPLDQADLSGSDDFYRDFTTLTRAVAGIDRAYQLGRANADTFIPKFRKVLSLFNKKYKDISLALRRTPSSAELRISLIGEQSLQSLFANSASRIRGLSAVGLKKFNEVPVNEQDRLEKTLSRMGKKAYVSYIDPDTAAASNIMIEKHGKHFLVVCDHRDFLRKNSPEFRLCAYYALRRPYNRKTDILGPASSFGFGESIVSEHRPILDELDPFSRVY